MNAVEFPEQNIVFAKDQPDYLPLPAYKHDDKEGTTITCWELTEEEKAEIAKTGKVWLRTLTFNQPLQPVMLSAIKADMFEEEAK